ncbi:hypothetical protein FHG87_020597 [Trinorchestia longiramus]|nr:hypothetical protein FHG87_020597 [Trinorchestia longiramus]
MNDYCFTLQSYPKCNYKQLRDFLVLPCKRKLQYITSSIDKDQVPREKFDKVQTLQQKNVFLLVDEVQIRPTVSIFEEHSIFHKQRWMAGKEPRPQFRGLFYLVHLGEKGLSYPSQFSRFHQSKTSMEMGINSQRTDLCRLRCISK